MKGIPNIIKQVGFDFDWDNDKVWALNLPVEKIEIKELDWHFGLPFWTKPGEKFYTLAPQEVIENPVIYKIEYQRTMNSDLSYPLDIMYWKERWLLLDGLHRLLKAKLLNKDKVHVRKVPVTFIPNIRKKASTIDSK